MYVSLCEMKTFLGIAEGDNTFNDLIESLITTISGYIDTYLGQSFDAMTQQTEFYRGNGAQRLRLKKRPVWSIVNLWFNTTGYWGESTDAFTTARLLTEGKDFALEVDQADGSSVCGVLYRINDVWTRPIGRITPFGGQAVIPSIPQALTGNLKIEYVAGYESVPEPIKLGVKLGVARIFHSGRFGAALSSERYEDYAYTLAIKNPDDVMAVVRPVVAQFKEPIF